MLQYRVTTDSDLTTNAVDHVISMLTLAEQKHGKSMTKAGFRAF
jgi:hypothetical protein